MIKKDDIEDTEEVGSSDPELEEEAAFPILNDLIDRIQLTAAPLESTGASVSVYAENLSDGARASINSSQMPAASLIKLYIAGCVYEQMDFVKEQEVYAGETEELLRLMITVSDNDAANELVRKLGFGDASAGMEVVNEFVGCTVLQILIWEGCFLHRMIWMIIILLSTTAESFCGK